MKGVRGPVNVETVNGSITASGLAGETRLSSVNGAVAAEFATIADTKKIRMNTVNGSATVTLPKGAGAQVDADSVNGRVNVDQPIKLGKMRRHSVTGQIGAGGADLSIDTVNGSISIRES